jgi:hypothetical protein
MGWTGGDLGRTILRKVPPSCVSVSNGETDFIGNFRVWKPFEECSTTLDDGVELIPPFAAAFWAHVGGFVTGLFCAALVLPRTTPEEREAILRPRPLTPEEKEELFADRAEKESELTTLNLNR